MVKLVFVLLSFTQNVYLWYRMSRLKIYDTSIPLEQIAQERAEHYMRLSPLEKLNELFALIDISKRLNGDAPIKEPQGKGFILRKKHFR